MDQLIGILKELHPDVDFENETALVDRGILNSFDIVSLIAEIDEAFGVSVPAQYILPENFNSAKSLMALIERLSDEI